MKQHIDTQQLSQLTDKGREKLISQIGNGKWLCLSIGQMIELLNNYNINVQISDTENSLISLTDNARWLVHDATIIKSLNKLYTDGGTGELCDALWSACVEVLNGE